MSRRLIVIVGGACAVLLLAWFALLWSPKGGELAAARDRRVVAEGRMHELEVRLAKLKASERQKDVLEVQAKRLGEAVPDIADLPGFISQVNVAASATKVNFASVVPSVPVPSASVAGASEIPVSINAEGGYFRMLDFIDAILGMSRIFVADTFDLQSQAEGGEVTVSISGRMFTTAPPPDPTLGTVAPGATSTPDPSITPAPVTAPDPETAPAEGVVLQ